MTTRSWVILIGYGLVWFLLALAVAQTELRL